MSLALLDTACVLHDEATHENIFISRRPAITLARGYLYYLYLSTTAGRWKRDATQSNLLEVQEYTSLTVSSAHVPSSARQCTLAQQAVELSTRFLLEVSVLSSKKRPSNVRFKKCRCLRMCRQSNWRDAERDPDEPLLKPLETRRKHRPESVVTYVKPCHEVRPGLAPSPTSLCSLASDGAFASSTWALSCPPSIHRCRHRRQKGPPADRQNNKDGKAEDVLPVCRVFDSFLLRVKKYQYLVHHV